MATIEKIANGYDSMIEGFVSAWAEVVPLDDLLRLSGMQSSVDTLKGCVERAAFKALFARVTAMGEAAAGSCKICSLKTEREQTLVRINTKCFELIEPVWRYRCRPCKTSRSPVRDLLALESGQTTIGLDRAMAALAIRMSFGEAAKQMKEQHGHELDRTLVQRRTYAAAELGEKWLAGRREDRVAAYQNTPGKVIGAERIDLFVDAGGVRAGKLKRPPASAAEAFSPKRRLPKGTRPSARREVRAVVGHKPGEVTSKVHDVHVAPLGQPEFTGHRMLCVAYECGLGDNTHVHVTSDMASWQKAQVLEQFGAQDRVTHCADFFHTFEYVCAAAPGLKIPESGRDAWRATQRRRLLEGQRNLVLKDLRVHVCGSKGCPKTDKGECAVTAAIRYLVNNAKHMDYHLFLSEDLTIGSGEVEGLIRHVVRKRLDIPGDWTEEKLSVFTSLLTIHGCGWWDDFWAWVDEQDRERLRLRRQGQIPNRFRGPKRKPVPATGTERLDFAELSPMFAHTQER
jgi:hypothetical protein